MKNTLNLTLRIGAIFAFAVFFSVTVSAQATRTWVSGVGDDVNPCSRTAPCKTFAGAISKTAANGEINTLDPGGYGTVTITKSMTIDGSTAGLASLLAAGTTGITINALSTDTVILRNLSINGAGTGINGIRILNAKAVYIENCVIFNFAGNSATNGRGITDERAHSGGLLFINNTTVEKNVQSNLFVSPTGGAVTVQIKDSRFIGSTSNSGAAIRGGSKASIRNSVFSGNFNFGIIAEADIAGTTMTIDSSDISNNGTGVAVATNSPVAQIANNVISGNGTGVLVSSGIMRSTNNRIDGNGVNVNGILSGYNVQ